MRPLALASLLLLASSAAAQEVPVEKLAEVKVAQERALEEVAQKYGERPASELTAEERRQRIADEAAALQAVFERHGVSAKQFARTEARLSREELAKLEAETAAIEQRAKAAEEKAAQDKAAEDAAEPEIITSGASGGPVEVYRSEDAVVIERPDDEAAAGAVPAEPR